MVCLHHAFHFIQHVGGTWRALLSSLSSTWDAQGPDGPTLHCEVSSDRTHEPNPTISLPQGYQLLNGLTWVLLIPLPCHTGQADQGHGKPHQFHLEAQPGPRTHPSTAVPQATLLCGQLSRPLLKAPCLLSPSPVLKGPRGFPAHAK